MKHNHLVCIELLFRGGYLVDSFVLNKELNDEDLSVEYIIEIVKAGKHKKIYLVYEPKSEPHDIYIPEKYTNYDALLVFWNDYCAISNISKMKKQTASNIFRLSDIEGLMIKYKFDYEELQ